MDHVNVVNVGEHYNPPLTRDTPTRRRYSGHDVHKRSQRSRA